MEVQYPLNNKLLAALIINSILQGGLIIFQELSKLTDGTILQIAYLLPIAVVLPALGLQSVCINPDALLFQSSSQISLYERPDVVLDQFKKSSLLAWTSTQV